MNPPKYKQFAKWLFMFSIVLILVAMLLATTQLNNVRQTRSHAQEPVGDCTQLDPGNENYCGDSAPFRGCVGGVGGNEWLCICRLKTGKWWSECSIAEDETGKQRWINQCGGDKEKAFMQWKYDIALMETGGDCSCGGQNVCGSLVPTKPAGVFTGGGGSGVAPTDVIYPTTAPRALPTQQDMPAVTNQNNSEQNVNTTSPLTGGSVSLPHVKLPSFSLPTIQFHPNLSGVNRLVSTPLDFFESLFNRITFYDSRLEHTINTVFHR